jgi:hypothetical protein
MFSGVTHSVVSQYATVTVLSLVYRRTWATTVSRDWVRRPTTTTHNFC